MNTLNAGALLAGIARTNVQLYNQLLEQGRSESDLDLIRSAYELAAQLYAGAYQADGKPFVVHVVSVASAVALLGQPSRFVATALVHNVYNNGDFGDGKQRDDGARRRRVLRAALGSEVEELVRRFAELRIDRNLDSLLARCDAMTEVDRNLVVMDLADLLEKHLDRGVLYFGQSRWVTRFSFDNVDELRRLATALGEPVLGQALAEAIASARDSVVPGALRSDPARKYLRFIAPLSHRKRWRVVLQQRIYQPLRTRLGRLKRRLA
ncbi:MAG: HD domain-containing protein [Pseudomonadales bacterium]